MQEKENLIHSCLNYDGLQFYSETFCEMYLKVVFDNDFVDFNFLFLILLTYMQLLFHFPHAERSRYTIFFI